MEMVKEVALPVAGAIFSRLMEQPKNKLLLPFNDRSGHREAITTPRNPSWLQGKKDG